MYFRTPESIHRLSLKKSLSYKITNQVGTVRNRTWDSTEPFNNTEKCFEDGKSESPRTSQRWKVATQPRRWFAMKFSFLPIPNIYALPTWHCCIFPNKNVQLRDIFMKPSLICQFFPQAKLILFPSNCSQRSVLHRVQILLDASQRSPPNVNGMQMNSTCKWAAQWMVTKMSCYSSSVTQKNKAASLHIRYLLSKTSVKHLVARFRVMDTS